MKKKGFTLIELLAVIVILAVIAIIVTPMIMGTIKSARENAAKASALNYVNAVDEYVAATLAKGGTFEDNKYNVSELSAVETTGAKPTSGSVTVVKGSVTDFDLTTGNYEVKRTGADGEVTVTEVGSTTVAKLTGTPISTIVDNLITAAGTNTYTYLGGTYLKGAQTNNYVWFNGFVWRIMGKDADGNIRMITEENVTAIPWGASGSAQQYGSSYAKKWTSSYFYSHISPNNQSIIKDTQFCEDSTLITDTASARTTCSVATVGANSGLLSLDEYNLAGGSSSYLVNGQFYWTLTPQSTSTARDVNNVGDAYGGGDVTNVRGLRPVITISSDAIITSGDGTLSATSNGYILNQTLDNVTNKKVSEIVTSGEYVTYDSKTYRVVEKNTDGVKLILDGFYTTYTAYGDDFSTIGSTLNDTNFQNWLLPTKTPQPVKWYRGAYFVDGNDYETNLSSIDNEFVITGTKSIGLIKVGEMMSGQSLSMLTNGYDTTVDVTSRSDNTEFYWTLTPYDTSDAWYVTSYGHARYTAVTYMYGLRPVIVISSDATITSGNGTLTAPFEVN